MAATLAQTLDVHCAFITEFTDNNSVVHPLAMWCGGNLQPEMRYAIAGSPCETVLNGEPVAFEEGVVDLFPDDRDGLQALQAESFLAIPLNNRAGSVIGHIAIMDSRPRRWADGDIGALCLFAGRAATEVERLQLQAELTETNRRLEARVLERTRELATANERLLRQIEHERFLSAEQAASEAGFRALFEHSPLSIWELDLTGVRGAIRRRAPEQSTDAGDHFRTFPGAADEILGLGSVRRFNSASLELFRISNPQDFVGASLKSIPQQAIRGTFADMVVELARGNLHGHREVRQSRDDGASLVCQAFWTVPPGYEESWSRLLIFFVDLTEQIRVSDDLAATQAALESRVAERTAELAAVNTRLRQEIATRARTERALIDSEAAYRDLYENAPNVYWSTGVDGRIRRANARAAELFGYSAEEFVNKPLFDLLADTAEGRDAGRRAFQRFLEGKSTRGQEVEFRAADGRSVWADVNIEPIFDQSGYPVATRSVLTDVTARKEAQTELANRLTLDQMVLEVSTILAGVGAANVDDELPRALGVIGEGCRCTTVLLHLFVDDEVSSVWWHSLGSEGPPPESPDLATIAALKSLSEPLWWSAESRVGAEVASRLFGDSLPGAGLAAPLTRGADRVGVMMMTWDRGSKPVVTRREADTVALLAELLEATLARCAAERELVVAKSLAESASRAKTDFLANMSHELRTPLNVILGYAQLLRRRPELESFVQDHLEPLQRSAETLLQQIDDVLELARVEAGKITVDPRPIELETFTADLAQMFKDRINGQGITFEMLVERALPAQVVVDGRRLQQILVNLIGNAVKFSRPGDTVTLTVAAIYPASDRVALRFSVIDHGIGIPAAELDHIFEPFVQLGDHNGDGVGLGLAISRTLAAALGGAITVTSHPGKGSTFTVTVPVQELATAAAVSALASDSDVELHPSISPQSLQALARAADFGDVAAIEAWLEGMTPEAAESPLIVRIREHLRHFDMRTIQRLSKYPEKAP